MSIKIKRIVSGRRAVFMYILYGYRNISMPRYNSVLRGIVPGP